MKYLRKWMKGIPQPYRSIIARELHMSQKKKAIERRRSHMARKPKLGSGGRFAAFKRRLEAKGMSGGEAGAVAASAGRKAHGKSAMARWAAKGRKRAANDNDGDE